MSEVNRLEIPGTVLETGCALGGRPRTAGLRRLRPDSSSLGLRRTRGASARSSLRSGQSESLKGGLYYGYESDLLATVERHFAEAGYPPQENGVRFVKGLYEDSLQIDAPVALAHIDCDWYESVKLCLERIGPHLSPGGRMIIDDYDHYSGCRKAVDEFLEANGDRFILQRQARVHLVCIGF